jgi:hypothetical protein
MAKFMRKGKTGQRQWRAWVADAALGRIPMPKPKQRPGVAAWARSGAVQLWTEQKKAPAEGAV